MSERMWMTGPLSPKASFRLFVSGPMGAREIGRLIDKLQIDLDILAEDAAIAAAEQTPTQTGTAEENISAKNQVAKGQDSLGNQERK